MLVVDLPLTFKVQEACVCCELLHGLQLIKQACVGGVVQVPLEELDLRRLREAAEEMREQLGLTSKAVSRGGRAGRQAGRLGGGGRGGYVDWLLRVSSQ